MPTPESDRQSPSHHALTVTMGQTVRRAYVRRPSSVRAGAAFAAAAVLAAAGPEDWQVSQDVADATVALIARCLQEASAATSEICVEVRLLHPIEVRVSTDSGWASSTRVERRRPPRA